MFHLIKILIVLVAIGQKAYANMSLNMPVGVTDVSARVYSLHMIIFWISIVIGIIVFGVMFYSIIFHRKSRGYVAATFHESTKVEIIWTIIPFIILIAMAVPATKTLIFMEDAADSELTIKITGYTWHWEYEYIDYDIAFQSFLSTSQESINNRDIKDENYLREVDNRLILPVNKKIRLLTTANDVIHSWWVPDFAVKKDAIPGFINETWTKINKIGVYRGQCAELCGAKHGYMPIVVEVVSEEDFDSWVRARQTAAEAT